jgi:release factor glutamine methyltransferase
MPDTVMIQTEGSTVRSALALFTAELDRAGVAEPGGDVRRLLAALLGTSAAALIGAPEQELDARQLQALRAQVARRAAREPVSRILGVREFYGRPFAISPATLDPRPDSETLVSVALDIAAREGWDREPLNILDVGTGSGCLLVTMLCELPLAQGTGTDISMAALEMARANAARLGVAGRAAFVSADALENVTGPVQLMVANPPYIRSSDIAGLEREVSRFDPLAALDGGADGLSIYRRMASRIHEVVPDGWFVCEVGHDQADVVTNLLAAEVRGNVTPQIDVHLDLAGHRRCVAMRTRG